MKLSSAERNGIIAGTFIGLVVSYVLKQWAFLPVCIGVGYAAGHFFQKNDNTGVKADFHVAKGMNSRKEKKKPKKKK